ncbi:MAG: CBS domain-containing protein [SAR324 cluster bacterium]|nr:CBS domain-containing protein [SAR324 cluster bacterium]
MKVKNIMTHNVITITQDMTALDALRKMNDNTIHHLLVTNQNNEVTGVLSTRDFPNALDLLEEGSTAMDEFLNKIKSEQFLVKDLMTPNPVGISPEAPLTDAAKLMLWHNIHSLPVVDNKKLVGIVTDRNLLSALGEMEEALH